jgi:PAS domain S-box-containing protein
MAGWYLHSLPLIQVFPNFAPMQYNTALGFITGGLGLIFVIINQSILSRLFGIFTFVIGFLTLIQYAFGINLGIDELLMDGYLMDQTSHPGRMAPNTALCFLLTGTSIFLFTQWHRDYVESAIEIVGMLIIALALTALLGYIQGVEKAYGWGNFTRMALHTIFGFILLGFSISIYVWNQKKYREFTLPLAIMFLLSVGILHFDFISPLGVATGASYCLLLFCSLWYSNPYSVYIFAVIASLLTLLGLIISPGTDIEYNIALLNRCISISVIWIVAVLLLQLRKTQFQFQKNALRLDNIINNSLIGIITINENGQIESFNHACETLFGYSEQELLGQNVNRLMAEPFRSEHDQYLKNYSKTGQAKILGIGRNVVAKRKDGMEFPIFLSVSEIYLSDRKIYSGFIRDISDIEQLNNQLQHEKNLLTILMDNIPDSIYFKDSNRRFTRVNKGQSSLLGITNPDEALGKSDEDFFVDEMAESTKKEEEKIIQTKTPVINYQREVKDKNGNTRWHLDTKFPILNSDGECTGIVGTARNITEIKKTEQELIKQKEELAKSNQQLEEFSYVASHDLQEPLRTVNNYMTLLKRKYGDTIDPNALRYIENSVDAAKRMSALIQDLLAFSRVTTHASDFVDVNVYDVLNTALKNLEHSIQEKNADVQFDPIPIIVADKGQFLQLIQNLVGNALKYVENPVPQVHILCKDKETEWLFSVQDNGIGIDPKFHDRIFKTFQRLHTREEYSGTGIGLAICQRIVERHGGKIWVESEEGKGSTFYFTIAKDLRNE